MTIDEIERQLAICEAATPMPLEVVTSESAPNEMESHLNWCGVEIPSKVYFRGVAEFNLHTGPDGSRQDAQAEANAEFFVAARAGYPEALKELAEARKTLAAWVEHTHCKTPEEVKKHWLWVRDAWRAP